MNITKRQLIKDIENKYSKYIVYANTNHISTVKLLNTLLQCLFNIDTAINDSYNLTDFDFLKLYSALDDVYIRHLPVQYITKKVKIYNEEYIVDEHTLIPRSDTETIISACLNNIDDISSTKILDMCTGCGTIGISLASNTKHVIVDLADISVKALDIAQQNIVLNGVSNRVKTINSNLFENITDVYDILVCNPPYISKEEYEQLDEFVKNEPYIALVSGESRNRNV